MGVKERLVELATEMFLRSGIKAITMDDISREAGISKRTIYENFQDKNDLIRNCLSYMDRQFNLEHDTITRESTNIIQLVFGLMKIAINAINNISPLFFDDLKRYHNKVWKEEYRAAQEKQHIQITTILKKGIDQGIISKEFDLEIMTILLMQLLRILHDKSVFPANRFSQRTVFEHMMISFFRGIATERGLKLIDKLLVDESDFFILS